MKKNIVRLKVKELMKAQIDRDIKTDIELANLMGISPSQVWRAKLTTSDDRYNAPGNHFIASVLLLFKEPFEKFFYIDGIADSKKYSSSINKVEA